jgi:hypothetical protein
MPIDLAALRVMISSNLSDVVADRLANFTYRVDRSDAAGDNVMRHVAGLEDYAVAQAAYDRACTRWPKEVVTLREGARVVEDGRRR